MTDPETIPPIHWFIFAVAALIAVVVLFSKAIKFLLKIAVIGGVLALVIYLLVQNGVITLPTFGN